MDKVSVRLWSTQVASFAQTSRVEMGLLIALTILTHQLNGQDYPEFSGKIDDNHGKLEWKSSTAPSGKLYTYSYAVSNNHTNARCRVEWSTFNLLTTIEPMQWSGATSPSFSEPRRIDSELRYNGGTAAGEGIAKPTAWVSNDAKSSHLPCEVKARLGVEVGSVVYPIHIQAKSGVEKDMTQGMVLSYELTISSAAGNPEPEIVRAMLNKVTVHWNSLASKEWHKLDEPAFVHGRVDTEKVLSFDKEASGSGPARFKAMRPLKDEAKVTIVSGSLTFHVDGPKNKQNVVASVMVPAISSTAE